jgi:integrase
MALPKFYLEPRKPKDDQSKGAKQAINMFYSFYGERLQYYTGVRIDPKFYKTEDSKGKTIDRSDVNKLISDSAPYASIIKANLKQIALDVQNISNAAKANKIEITKKYLSEQLDKIHKHKEEEKDSSIVEYNFISYFDTIIKNSESGIRVLKKGKKAGHKYSSNTIKNYKSTLSSLKRYMEDKRIKRLGFEEINTVFYEQFKNFCYGTKENKEISTFGGYIKDIITIMDEANEEGYQKFNGHKASTFIIPAYESDTKALTLDEIDAIHKHDFSSKPRLDRVRDLFLIGCYSALRFTNFNNMKIENIENGFIRLKQVKTGDRVVIPVMQRMQGIIDKYNGSLPTPVSNQEFNRVIKDVVKEAGLTYTVEVNSFTGGVQSVETTPIYELISGHTPRRSYATIMFKKRVPTMLIMGATGHKSESAFLKYIKATNEDKAILMAEALKDLGL